MSYLMQGLVIVALWIVLAFTWLFVFEATTMRRPTRPDPSTLDLWSMRFGLGFIVGLALQIGTVALYLPGTPQSPAWLWLGMLVGLTLASGMTAVYLRGRT